MSDGEISLLGVDFVNLSVLLREKAQSELVLLFGAKGQSIFRDMLNEGLLNLL